MSLDTFQWVDLSKLLFIFLFCVTSIGFTVGWAIRADGLRLFRKSKPTQERFFLLQMPAPPPQGSNKQMAKAPHFRKRSHLGYWTDDRSRRPQKKS